MAKSRKKNRQEFQRSQLTELADIDFESWAKESFEKKLKRASWLYLTAPIAVLVFVDGTSKPTLLIAAMRMPDRIRLKFKRANLSQCLNEQTAAW